MRAINKIIIFIVFSLLSLIANGQSSQYNFVANSRTICSGQYVDLQVTLVDLEASGVAADDILFRYYSGSSGTALLGSVKSTLLNPGGDGIPSIYQGTFSQYVNTTRNFWVTYQIEGQSESSKVELKVTISSGNEGYTTSHPLYFYLDGDLELCPGEEFELIAKEGSWYKWYRSETSSKVGLTLVGTSQTYTVRQRGYYWLDMAASGGCGSSDYHGPIDLSGYDEIVKLNDPEVHFFNETQCFGDITLSADIELRSYRWYHESDLNASLTPVYSEDVGRRVSFSYVPENLGSYYAVGTYGSNGQCTTKQKLAVKVVPFSDQECEDYLNYTTQAVFDENNNPISESTNYFDLTGQALQSQSTIYDWGGNKVYMATQSIKDKFGRDVIQTLPAPTLNDRFLYNHKFVTAIEDEEEVSYSERHFDGDLSKKENPDPVANNTPGTLGWYYSENNYLEPNIPQTAYPYSRTDFYEDGTGEVRAAASPGDGLRMGTGHEVITKALPVTNPYSELPFYAEINALFSGNDSELAVITKQVTIDADGKEVVVFSSENGVIAAARVDPNVSTSLRAPVIKGSDGQRSIQIHLSDENNTVSWKNRGGNLKIINKLKEDELIDIGQAAYAFTLDKGFYEITDVDSVIYNIHYTDFSYNFYNTRGNLIAAMTPKGVSEILETKQVPADKEELAYTTFNYYDFKGNLIRMVEPDAGETNYLYRKDGSIRFSQNAEQAKNDYFSYTCYDRSGRPIESGEYRGTAYDFSSINNSDMLELIGPSGFKGKEDLTEVEVNVGVKPERVHWVETVYDLPDGELKEELSKSMKDWFDDNYGPTYKHYYKGGLDNESMASYYADEYIQDFLNGAVSYTENEESKIWYSYDEFGQVAFVVTKYKHMGDGQCFRIDYSYDYFGNVTEVAYQKYFVGESFYHIYEYNKNQQLTHVYTSQSGSDDPAKYLQASYEYYLHGPLKRVQYAEDLQGIDYTYTAQGWLKAINHPAIDLDPGQDGENGVFPDAFGMQLDYYTGDHQSNAYDVYYSDLSNEAQFGGNIRSVTWGRKGVEGGDLLAYYNETFDKPLTSDITVSTRSSIELLPGFESNGHVLEATIEEEAIVTHVETDQQQYEYRYDSKNQLTEAVYTDEVALPAADSRYQVNIPSYDLNGNIEKLERFDRNGMIANDFSYDYKPMTNQLKAVSGYASYDYNAIGQMTQSLARDSYGDQFYSYDVTGKVTAIYGSQADLDSESNAVMSYAYDDRGFRIMKADSSGAQTWYVRDASGNIIGIYQKEEDRIPLREMPIYGSGKIGTAFANDYRQKYSYELTDHLGNVRAVVSKLKFYEVATMEEERLALESSVFENVDNSAIRHLDQLYNTTYVTRRERYSARLDGSSAAVGPAMAYRVSKGDEVSFSVRAMYNPDDTGNGLADDVFGLVAGAYGLSASGETQAVYDGLTGALASSGAFLSEANGDAPKAYIQCLIFDEDHNKIGDAHAMITEAAAGYSDTADSLYATFTVEQPGFIYIYVMNETLGQPVNFDDMTVRIMAYEISEMTDYYPFGSIASQWKKPKEDYRFGYQGQFAEEDKETGFNHFEAREYDPLIGRWMAVDPARQFASPYNGMGNNPMNGIDIDGRLIIYVNGYNSSPSTWNHISSRFAQFFHDKSSMYTDIVDQNGWALQKQSGREWVKNNLEAINKEFVKTGTVRIVSHSMGIAKAAGIQEELKAQGIITDTHVAIAPHYTMDMEDVPTYQFRYALDWLSVETKLIGSNVQLYSKYFNSHELGDFDFDWVFSILEMAKKNGEIKVGQIQFKEYNYQGE